MTAAPKGNFIRDIIDADLASGKHKRVVTRFPPEPNGYLHIGHAKSICLNFGTAQDYGGVCHLRFDDTNPTKEETEYVEAIERDVRWLGFHWYENLFFASGYFDQLYDYGVHLIQHGNAYVCSLSEEDMRAFRGTVNTPGTPSPFRNRSVEENLNLFARMKAGEFPDGAHTLRAKIDMAHPNMKLRDPPLYRIRHAHHHRTGDAWCLYPMYDYAHCISDAIEGITHSICTLEFENNRAIYDWILDRLPVACHPQQIEFARLNLTYTVMSKRKLLALVENGSVWGWDDPRMPTLAGLRRRGVTPSAIRAFCESIGVAKANSTVDLGQLEFWIRDDLNQKSPRAMAVFDPLKVVITNFAEGGVEMLHAPYWPEDIAKEGSRDVPFTREILIERSDFEERPPKGYHRLSPGQEVRLRYGYIIRCEQVVKNAAGEVTELRCSYDPGTRGGNAADGRKVKGTIHWVSASHGFKARVRLIDRLFTRPDPEAEGDFNACLNPDALRECDAVFEPALRQVQPEMHVQLERTGYFYVDPIDSRPGVPMFHRVVTLRDSWAKVVAATETEPAAPAAKPRDTKPAAKPSEAKQEPSPSDAAAAALLVKRFGITEDDALTLHRVPGALAFFEQAAAKANPALVANWTINEVLRITKASGFDALPFNAAALAELVELLDTKAISGPIAKEVFQAMAQGEGSPRAIVQARGWHAITDDQALGKLVQQVLDANPEQIAAYRQGKTQLLGFFVGQAVKASGGRADPGALRKGFEKKLQA